MTTSPFLHNSSAFAGAPPRRRKRAGWFSPDNLTAFAIAFWFMDTFYNISLEAPARHIVQLVTVGWLFVWGTLRFGGKFIEGPVFRTDSAFKMLFLLFFTWGMVSAILCDERLFATAMLIALFAGLLNCAGAWTIIGGNALRVLRAYALLATVFCLCAYAVAPSHGGRFAFLVHPNQWGRICFASAIAALAIPSIPLRLFLIAGNVFIITQAQSRTALLCVMISLGTWVVARLYQGGVKNRLRTGFLALSVALIVTAIIAFLPLISETVSSVLQIDDRVRGIGTGFTGRTDFWIAAWNVFLDHPVFGIGPRNLEQLQISTGLAIGHNGYLAVLADVGLPGASFLFMIIILRMWRVWKLVRLGDQAAAIGFALAPGYLFSAFFEMHLLNVGDPLSMLMWVFLFMPPAAVVLPARAGGVWRPARQMAPLYAQPLPRRI